ncbi:MAG: M23 family metallopeptidase [Phenylobacterium sp.]
MRLAPLAALGLAAALAPAAARPAAPEEPRLALPIACEPGKTCFVQNYVDRDAGPGALDFRCGHRTYDKHDGTDIRILDMAAQRAGVDVLAAAAGRVVAVRDGVPDISIRAPGAPSVAGHECGNRVGLALGSGWIIDYCHLAQGSPRVKVGDMVAVGQPLGRVGLSGQTEFPHLHFSVRHDNAVVDPFSAGPVAPGACPAQPTLWTEAAARALGYRRGAVLNTGFASGNVTPETIEAHVVQAPAASAALVAYVRLIGLESADVVDLKLSGPDGKVLAQGSSPPLDHDKAQWFAQIGRAKPPAGGWPHGAYVAEAAVRRGGAIALSARWQVAL